ncbi:Putative ribonuclease H protein At1g65750, partial [Linum perenne]
TLKFRKLLERDWSIKVTHIYREGNHLADYLAGKGHNLGMGTHIVSVADQGVQYWVNYDRVGSTEARSVRVL